mgnify:CR=1 FL=1
MKRAAPSCSPSHTMALIFTRSTTPCRSHSGTTRQRHCEHLQCRLGSCIWLLLWWLLLCCLLLLLHHLCYCLLQHLPGLKSISQPSIATLPHCPCCCLLQTQMSHYNALYCTALYCTVLHCSVLYCFALHCIVPGTRSSGNVPLAESTELYSTVLHCTDCRTCSSVKVYFA